MLQRAKLGALFVYFIPDIQIKIWIHLQEHSKLINKLRRLCHTQEKAPTSVLGSNMFFNKMHSLGSPIGSEAGSNTGAAKGAWPFRGKANGKGKAGWFGWATPLTKGTPSDSAMLREE